MVGRAVATTAVSARSARVLVNSSWPPGARMGLLPVDGDMVPVPPVPAEVPEKVPVTLASDTSGDAVFLDYFFMTPVRRDGPGYFILSSARVTGTLCVDRARPGVVDEVAAITELADAPMGLPGQGVPVGIGASLLCRPPDFGSSVGT